MRQALGRANGPATATGQHQPATAKAAADARVPGRSMGERPRKHFVQDGEVPVTIVNRPGLRQPDAFASQPVNRVSVAHAALANERVARERAERSLAEALATIHELRTKLGHAELARQEAANAGLAAREALEALRTDSQEREARLNDEFAAERTARIRSEAALERALNTSSHGKPNYHAEAAATPRPKLKPAAKTSVAHGFVIKPAKITRPSVSAPRSREPQPVKWWLKKAKKR